MKKEIGTLAKRITTQIEIVKKKMQAMLEEDQGLATSEDFVMLNNILDMGLSQSIIVHSMMADLAKLSPDKIASYRESVKHTLAYITESVSIMEQGLA